MIYAFVRNVVCITIHYTLAKGLEDPMIVKNGSVCDDERVNDLKSIFLNLVLLIYLINIFI